MGLQASSVVAATAAALFSPPSLQHIGVPNMQEIIILACTECKQRNYTTTKNKRNTPGRLEKKKYCPFERKSTLHRETR
mgnify:CR=1 FL=1